MGINFIKQFVAAGLTRTSSSSCRASADDQDIDQGRSASRCSASSTPRTGRSTSTTRPTRSSSPEFEKEYKRLPTDVRLAGLRHGAADRRGGAATSKGKIEDKEALRKALKAAKFESLRGTVQVQQATTSDPGLLPARGRQGRARAASSTRRSARCSSDSQDVYVARLQDEVDADRLSSERVEASACAPALKCRVSLRRDDIHVLPPLIVEQLLNGLQFGLMLFLLAAGLTLVFGIMDMINLAHGSLYMIGAYLAATLRRRRPARSWLGVLLAHRRHGAGRHAARE